MQELPSVDVGLIAASQALPLGTNSFECLRAGSRAASIHQTGDSGGIDP